MYSKYIYYTHISFPRPAPFLADHFIHQAAISCQERKKPQCRGPESCRLLCKTWPMPWITIIKHGDVPWIYSIDDFLEKSRSFRHRFWWNSDEILMKFWWNSDENMARSMKHVETSWNIIFNIEMLNWWVFGMPLAKSFGATSCSENTSHHCSEFRTGTWIRTYDLHGSRVWISPWHILASRRIHLSNLHSLVILACLKASDRIEMHL